MLITQRGHDGYYVLTGSDGQPVEKEQIFATSRGESVKLTGGAAPHKPSSTGRVYVLHLGEGGEELNESEYFPSVIDCKWVKVKE